MMRYAIVAAAFAVTLLASPTVAQQLSFGNPVPLTNTRYAAAAGVGRLVSNGAVPYLFWSFDGEIRVTRVVPTERRVGRHLARGFVYDAAWTGQQFLFVWSDKDDLTGASPIRGQLLDASADPLSTAFDVGVTGDVRHVAANGRAGVLLYDVNGIRRYAALTAAGAVRETATLLVPGEHAGPSALANHGDGFVAVVPTSLQTRLFFFGATGRLERTQTLSTRTAVGLPAIASNGRESFVTWYDGQVGIQAAVIGADGRVSSAIAVEDVQRLGVALAATWTGDAWVVAREHDDELRFFRMDAAVQQSATIDGTVAGAYPSLAVAGGKVFASWAPSRHRSVGAVRAATLPLAAAGGETVTYAAVKQQLLTVAAASTGTLVVWREDSDASTSYHVGVRSPAGGWIERKLIDGAIGDIPQAFAASDGRGFMLVLQRHHSMTPVAFGLDSETHLVTATYLPFEPTGIAWRTSDYVLVGGDYTTGAVVAVALTPSGVLSPAVEVSRGAFGGSAHVATNGTISVVTAITPQHCPITCPRGAGYIHVVRLGPDLRPLEAPKATERLSWYAPAAVWDGDAFFVVWVEERVVRTMRVPASGAWEVAADSRSGDAEDQVAPDVVRTAGGVAYAWRSVGASRRDLVEVLAAGVAQRRELSSARSSDPGPRLAALATGGVAHFAAKANLEPPHHGSRRVMMTIGSAAPVRVPDAPQIAGATSADGRVRIDWTPPRQPVSGYRVEYRIGDGSWNELERWYRPDETSALVTVVAGVSYSFRVRAFHEAGTSDYSSEVRPHSPKRRSVR